MEAISEALPFVSAATSNVARSARRLRDRTRSDSAEGRSCLDHPYPGTLGVFRHLISAGSIPVWRQLGVVHQGWLTKRGGNFANWKRRWFVLRGDVIFYFRDTEDLKHLGEIPLSDNVVRRVEQVDTKAPAKFLFEIIPGEGSEGFAKDRGSYLLCAGNQLDMEEWISKINHVIAREQTCMFKQSVSETVSREAGRRHSGVVPLIVVQCCCFLYQYGLRELGLFRQPGRVNRIKQFQEQYDKGRYPEFGSSTDTDVHTVASLLKLYLRSIPEAVIPQEYNNSFIAATRFYRESSSSEGVQVMIGQLKGLPKASYNCLKYVCRFLYKVQENADANRMDSSNLAVVFGPNFVRPSQTGDSNPIADVKDMMKVVKDTGDMNVLTRILIDEHEKLFPASSDESPVFHLHEYSSLDVGLCADGDDGFLGSGLSPRGDLSRASKTSVHSATAVFNPFCSGDPSGPAELLSFSSSDDERPDYASITSMNELAEQVSCAQGPGYAVINRHLADGVPPPTPALIDLAPNGSALTANSSSSDAQPTGQQREVAEAAPPSTQTPSVIIGTNSSGSPLRPSENRLTAFSSRLEEMQLEMERCRKEVGDAQYLVKREQLSKRAWEKRYQDERKAREAAETRVQVLEDQLYQLFNRHFPVNTDGV